MGTGWPRTAHRGCPGDDRCHRGFRLAAVPCRCKYRVTEPLTDLDFAALMAPLGPFEPAPRLAAAVSGGPDSTALALLAHAWVRRCGGSLLALIVDHGLRPESGQEATTVAARLAERSINARILPLTGLTAGPALAERARTARYATLLDACRDTGIFAPAARPSCHRPGGDGDHAGALVQWTGGLAGMAVLHETASARLLRPLLSVPPAPAPRATLAEAGGRLGRRPVQRRSPRAAPTPARLACRSRWHRGRNRGAGSGRTCRRA